MKSGMKLPGPLGYISLFQFAGLAVINEIVCYFAIGFHLKIRESEYTSMECQRIIFL